MVIMKAIDWFKKHSSIVIENVVWNDDKGFHIPGKLTKLKGIYAFVSDEGIEKVGKADGKTGITGRMSHYRTSVNRITNLSSPDRSCIHQRKTMTEGALKDKKLTLYVYLVTPTEATIDGITVNVSPARELEIALSEMATKDNEPMRLSKIT